MSAAVLKSPFSSYDHTVLNRLAPFGPADVTAPTLESVVISEGGTDVVLTFDENVKIGAGGNGGLSLTMSGGAVTPTFSSGSGTTELTYSLSRTIEEGETGTADYTQPGDGIEDSSGNDLASFSDENVTNESLADVTAPTLVSASISGGVLTLTCSEDMQVGAGGNGGVSLTASGGALTPTFDAVSGSTVTYTLSREPAASETITVDYTQPGDGIEDLAGNDLGSFSGESVSVAGGVSGSGRGKSDQAPGRLKPKFTQSKFLRSKFLG